MTNTSPLLSLATLLKRATKELCFEGTDGVPLDTLWKHLSTNAPQLDQFMKQLMFENIKNDDNIEFLVHSEGKKEPEIISMEERKALKLDDENKFLLRAELDYQFLQLTNEPRSKTCVGAAAYELLLEIAKARSAGIDSLTLTTITGQDQRSLTTRINSLNHLITKLQILKKGRVLSLFFFNLFATADVINGITEVKTKDDGSINENFNLNGFREKLMNILEKSKGGIRQFSDLRRELEWDKSPRYRRLYRTSITYLEDKGHLVRVFITLAKSNKKTRAVRFIKPFVDQNSTINDIDEDEEEQEDDDQAEEEEEEEEEEVPEFNDSLIDDELRMLTGGTSVQDSSTSTWLPTLNENKSSKLRITNVSDSNFIIPSFHRFESPQSQLHQLIDTFKQKGSTSSNSLNHLFGAGYARIFYRLTECYIHEKYPKRLSNQQIVRFYDSKGRLRFYRYFTRPNFNQLTGTLDEHPEELSGAKPSNKTLQQLNKKEYVTLSSKTDIYEVDAVKNIYWHGAVDVPESIKKTLTKNSADYSYDKSSNNSNPEEPRRKRGRPRKGEVRPKTEVKKPKGRKSKKGASPEPEERKDEDTGATFGSVDAGTETNANATTVPDDKSERQPTAESDDVTMDGNESSIALSRPPLSVSTNFKTEAVNTCQATPSHTLIEKPRITFEDLSGNSFQTIERYQSIIQVLVDCQGIKLNNFDFLKQIRQQLGYNADKKTLTNDLHSLIQQGKIYKETIEIYEENKDKMTPYQVIVLDNTSKDVINEFTSSLVVRKAKNLPRKFQVLDDVALEYFDETLDYDKMQEKKKEATYSAKAAKAEKIKNKREVIGALKRSSKKQIDRAVHREKKLSSKLLKSLKNGITNSETSNISIGTSAKNKKAGRKAGPSVNSSRRRISKTLTSQESLTLFKAVIICKTINKSDILWHKIANLFTGKDPAYLRTIWPRIRTMMGPSGVVKATRSLKRLILRNIKAGNITDEEVLNLDDNLGKLVQLWEDSESAAGKMNLNEIEQYDNEDEGINDQLNDYLNEKLYNNLKENFERFKLLKVPRTYKVDLSSMIKKEKHLANKAFSYNADSDDDEEEQGEVIQTVNTDDASQIVNETSTISVETNTTERTDLLKSITPEQSEVRKIILSIVLGGENFHLDKLEILEKYSKKTIDEVFFYMAKTKEIFLSTEDNKIHIGEKLSRALSSPLDALDFSLIHKFQALLPDLFSMKKGILLSPIFNDALMIPMIELLSSGLLNLTRIDHYKRELFEGYEARALDKTYLQSDIVLFPTKTSSMEITKRKEKSLPVPNKGQACSYIWINLQGEVIKDVWMKLVNVALVHVLFHPGITMQGLFDLKFRKILLEYREFDVVMQWLIDSKVLQVEEEDGLWVTSQFYQNI